MIWVMDCLTTLVMASFCFEVSGDLGGWVCGLGFTFLKDLAGLKRCCVMFVLTLFLFSFKRLYVLESTRAF